MNNILYYFELRMKFYFFIAILFLMFSCQSDSTFHKTKTEQIELENPCLNNFNTNNKLNLSKEEIKIAANIDAIFKQKVSIAHFNGVILVAKSGKIIYKNKAGYKNLMHKDSFQYDTPFQLASLSKPFTAIALLQLVKENKLHLDSTVSHYLPDFPYKNITLKHLLSHTSGLPDYVKTGKLNQLNTLLNVSQFISKNPVLFKPKFNPGTSFDYSNTNYVLAAEICEKTSGISFESFLTKKILTQLHINNAHCIENFDTVFQLNKAIGHQGNYVKPSHFLDNILGDKSLYLSAVDLFQFYLTLRNKCLLNDSLYFEMTKPQTLFGKKYGKAYGLGFRMYVYPQKKYLFHNGLWGGFNTSFFYSPNDDYSIIVLGNTSNKNVYEISGFVDALQDEFLGANYYKHLAQRNNFNPEEASIRPEGLRDDFDLPILKVDTNKSKIKEKYLPKIKVDTIENKMQKKKIALPKKISLNKKSMSEIKIKHK